MEKETCQSILSYKQAHVHHFQKIQSELKIKVSKYWAAFGCLLPYVGEFRRENKRIKNINWRIEEGRQHNIFYLLFKSFLKKENVIFSPICLWVKKKGEKKWLIKKAIYIVKSIISLLEHSTVLRSSNIWF